MAGDGPYISEDERYGAMLGNLLNPPDDEAKQAATVAQPAPTPQPAPRSPVPTINPSDPRFAVPSGQPPNPVLKVRPAMAASTPSPSPAVPPRPATPNAVTPTGNGPAAPSSTPSFYQRAQQGALDALDQSEKAAAALQNQPDAVAQNAPLEAQRTTLAQPLDPQASQYKPGIGTRILRGVGGYMKDGPLGAVNPGAAGATPYNAPNRQFDIDTARRGAQVTAIDREEAQNIANQKANNDRQKDIGTETRAVSTGYGSVARDATSQENADTSEATRKDNSPAGVTAVTQAQFDQRGKIADSLKLKGQNRTLYLVNGKLPDPRQATEAEIARSQATLAWQRQNPGKSPTLDDVASINAAAAGYGNARGTSNLTKTQQDSIINRKNSDMQKAQAQYNKDSDSDAFRQNMQDAQDNYEEMLGVDKNGPDHMIYGANGQFTRAGGQQAPGSAPAQTAPSAWTVPVGQTYNGYKRLAGDWNDPKSWEKVGP